MKRVYRASLIAVALLFAVTLTACGSATHIEDANGAENSLCVLTEKELTDKHPNSLSNMSVLNEKDGVTEFSVRKFSGVKSIYSFRAKADRSYTLEVTSELEEGNLRLFVWCGGEIMQGIAVGGAQTVTVNGANGRCELRAAGESANFSMSIVCEEND